MYSTASCSPSFACSGGRYDMSDVLAERRPRARGRDVRAAAVRVGERRAVAASRSARARAGSASCRCATRGRRSSACRASRPARPRGARGAPPCRRSPRPSPSTTPCRPRRRCSPRRARSRTRDTPSRAGRSCRRRRCPPGRSPCGCPASQTASQSSRAVLHRHVELPAEVADVRDARREHLAGRRLERSSRC